MRGLMLVSLLIVGLVSRAPAQEYGPDDAPIETTDIDRFWQAWDRLPAATTYADTLRAFFELYYLPGSPGLHDFIRARIGSVIQLVDQIRRNPRYYASIREPTLSLRTYTPQVRATLRRWAELVPEAKFPSIYVVIGRMTSGGTTSQARILIGGEMYGRTPDTPEAELAQWHREVLAPPDRLPAIVAHELFHTQQHYARDQRLIARVLGEGVPDFLAALISDTHINANVHAWAEPRARQLWQDFQAVRNGTDNAGWLYGHRAEGEPNDLGYWLGYRIARAYYRRAADKGQALRDMLAIQDFDAFVRASGIAEELGAP